MLDVHIPFMNVVLSISCTPRVIKVHSESLLVLDLDSFTLLAPRRQGSVQEIHSRSSSEIEQHKYALYLSYIYLYVYVMMFIDVWGRVLVLAYLILNMLFDIRFKIYIFSAGRFVDAFD